VTLLFDLAFRWANSLSETESWTLKSVVTYRTKVQLNFGQNNYVLRPYSLSLFAERWRWTWTEVSAQRNRFTFWLNSVLRPNILDNNINTICLDRTLVHRKAETKREVAQCVAACRGLMQRLQQSETIIGL